MRGSFLGRSKVSTVSEMVVRRGGKDGDVGEVVRKGEWSGESQQTRSKVEGRRRQERKRDGWMSVERSCKEDAC